MINVYLKDVVVNTSLTFGRISYMIRYKLIIIFAIMKMVHLFFRITI